MLLSGIVVGGRILYTALYIFQQPGVAKEKNVF